MDIINIIRKCDSWTPVEDDGADYGRYFVKVRFDSKEDAQAFAVELLMVTSGQEPYGDSDTPTLRQGHSETGDRNGF